MRLFGLSISRTKATPPASALSTPSSRGGWFNVVREGFAGAWQRNIEWRHDDVLTYSAVFACVTLIASDIAKLPLRLVKQTDAGVWEETENPAFSPVLREPNHYQTRIDFILQWLYSLLIHGNTYVLKERDGRGVVTGLYVLDPLRTRPMVAPTGDIYYALAQDARSGVEGTDVIVPAREIIHDRINTFYDDLVGLSPLTACGLAATQGLRVQNTSAQFFGNGATPGGILTHPRTLSAEEVATIRDQWEANYSGPNFGRVAVLAGELKYEPVHMMSAVDAQLIDQLGWTDKNVCMAFKVPAYMINAGDTPSYDNVQALNIQYYSQCLQALIESIELRLDKGLELPKPYGTEFDIDSLLRMDTKALVASLDTARNYLTPNEGRKKLNLPPTVGGDVVYRQHQDYSLEALSKRDAKDDPFSTGSTPPPASRPTSGADDAPDNVASDDGAVERRFEICLRKAMAS